MRLATYSVFSILWMVMMSMLPVSAEAQKPYFRIMLEDVESSVSEALGAEKIADNISATITSTRDKVLYAAYRPVHVEIATLKYDASKSTWSANMLVKDGEGVLTAKPLAGRFDSQTALPVLSDRIKHGHVIGDDDVEMRFFPVSKVRSDTVTDPNQIIGKTPRRTIAAHRPLRVAELGAPMVMEQGSTVHMQYRTSSMKISTMGEVLQDGGVGDYVRVRNHDSNKVVRARIISAQEVAVGY